MPTLDERYGRTPALARRRRVVAATAGAAFTLVFGAWLIWAGLQGANASIEFRDVGHEILDEGHVSVSWRVTAEPGSRVNCAIEALNEGFSVVGWKIVTLPPSTERSRILTEQLLTTELAVSGLIYRCWLA